MSWAKHLIEGSAPCPRGGHTATLFRDKLIVFGGHFYADKVRGFQYLNDVHVLDLDNNRWTRAHCKGLAPAARYYHSAVLATQGVLFFGGKGAHDRVFKDFYALNPESMTWFVGPEGSGSPCARFGHSASLLRGSQMVVFGGYNGQSFFNDVYVLDLETMCWGSPELVGTPPAARYLHAAIPYKSYVLVHGGFALDRELGASETPGATLSGCYLNDMRLLDLDARCWHRFGNIAGRPLAPRFGHTMNLCGNSLLLLGGWANELAGKKRAETAANTRALNFAARSWEVPAFAQPPPMSRYGHSATAFPGGLIVFGGWEFNRSTNDLIVFRKA